MGWVSDFSCEGSRVRAGLESAYGIKVRVGDRVRDSVICAICGTGSGICVCDADWEWGSWICIIRCRVSGLGLGLGLGLGSEQ